MDASPPDVDRDLYGMSVRVTHHIAIDSSTRFGFAIRIDDQLGLKNERRQFRFPRSKKRRIQRKWAKHPNNFKTVTSMEPAAYRLLDVVVMNSAMFKKLKLSLATNP